MTRRAGEPSSAGDLGALDPAAIERVRDEVRPEPVDPHEMHDVLMSAGFVLEDDLPPAAREHLAELRRHRRATPARAAARRAHLARGRTNPRAARRAPGNRRAGGASRIARRARVDRETTRWSSSCADA